MADDNSHVSRVIEDLRRQAVAKLDEVRAVIAGINAVEAGFGLSLTTIQDLVAGLPSGPVTAMAGPVSTVQSPGSAPARRWSGAVRPDEFLGEEPMEAAKKYIGMVGYAVHFDEIANAVERGGAVVQGANWRERLETSLMRSPYQVVKVSDKTYGLASFYSEEQLNRLRNTRRDSRFGPAGSKGKAKGKSKAKTKGKAVIAKAQPKAPAKASAPQAEPKE